MFDADWCWRFPYYGLAYAVDDGGAEGAHQAQIYVQEEAREEY